MTKHHQHEVFVHFVHFHNSLWGQIEPPNGLVLAHET